MFIISAKDDNRIINMHTDLDYLSNGYPRLTNKNVAFTPEFFNTLQVEEIPTEIVPEEYCYTVEDGFYLNPDYKEPSPLDNPAYAEGYQQALLDLMEVEG